MAGMQLVLTLLLVSLASRSFCLVRSSSSSKTPVEPTSQDLSQAKMQELLGQKIVRMRIVERPLDGLDNTYGKSLGPYAVKHSGVEVVTQDGKHWLIHKGGNTVITPLSSMSNRWSTTTDWRDSNIKVTDAISLSGRGYNLLLDNCNMASSKIYESSSSGSRPHSPVQNNRPPVQNYRPPVQNYRPPVQNYRPPVQNYRPPVQNWRPPVQNWRPPVQNWRPPVQNWRPPVYNWRPPVYNYRPPVYNWRPPVYNWRPRV